MKTINRTAITIIPKQPYADWINSFENVLDYDDNQETTILIPDKYDEIDYEIYLKKFLKQYLKINLNHGLLILMSGPKNGIIKCLKNGFTFFVQI